MSSAMELTQQHLETIGGYVKSNLSEWLSETRFGALIERDLELRERMVRVEEELKAQRELMKQGFEQVDKRFEQVDKRFEQIDRRFEQVDKRFEDMNRRFDDLSRNMTRWMTVLIVLSAMFSLAVALTNVLL